MSNSIFEINFSDIPEYGELVNTLYMVFFIIITIHILLTYSYNDKQTPVALGMIGGLFNPFFINLLTTIMIAFLAYYLIGKKNIIY